MKETSICKHCVVLFLRKRYDDKAYKNPKSLKIHFMKPVGKNDSITNSLCGKIVVSTTNKNLVWK